MVTTMKVRREALGISQAEVARRAQMHSTTVCLIESGRLRPGAAQLRKLAVVFGLPEHEAEDLLEEAVLR